MSGVVLYHAWPSVLSGGFIGVDVFFVLSGYLITGLLVEEVERTGRVSFSRFYGRRIRRLLPASSLALVGTLIASLLLLSPLELPGVADSGLAVSLYASNLWFLRQYADYFGADQGGNPLLHTWSLTVEEQFYVVWPVMVFVVLRLARRSRHPRRTAGGVLAAMTFLSFVSCAWLTTVRQPYAFFGTPARAWEFGLGGLASLIPAAWLVQRAAWTRAAAWLGLLAVAAASVLFSAAVPFPGVAALVPVLGTVAVLVAGAGDRGPVSLLSAAPLQYVGRLSYSWYLWHWPALVLGAAVVPRLSDVGRLLAIGLALALAHATYMLVENPVRHHRALGQRATRSLWLGALLCAAGVGASLAVRGVAHQDSKRPDQRPLVEAATRRARTDDPACTNVFFDASVHECVLGRPAASTTVVLLGDSHASQWSPALDAVARDRGWRLVSLTKSSCPVADVAVYTTALRRPYSECTAWRRAAWRRIAALQPAAVIVAQYALPPTRVDGRGRWVPATEAEWRAGMERALAALAAGPSRPALVVLRDTPRPGFDVPICLSRAVHRRQADAQACVVARATALSAAAARAEAAALAATRRGSLVDLSDELCDRTRCPPVRDGLVVYRDNNHLSVGYVERLIPVLAQHLDRLVPRS